MLIFYLEKTKTLRGNITQWFITTQKPYKGFLYPLNEWFVLVDQKAITITLAVFEKFEVGTVILREIIP
jgi:hypothetical protein